MISPVTAPFIWIIVLSAVVVPCTMRSVAPRERGEVAALAARARRFEVVHHALALVLRRGRGLVEVDRAIRADQDEIGEGPADVDADPVASRSPSAGSN